MTFVRALVILVLAGCQQSDPCDAFPAESCLTLEVRAGVSELDTIDQLHVAATSGFLLSDGLSPPTPRRFQLPVQVAILPGKEFAGPFSLLVRGFLDGSERGRDEIHGAIDQPHQHQRQVATLFPNGIRPDSDLAGVDFAGVDFSLPPPADLAGADFSAPPLPDLASTDLAFKLGWTVTPLGSGVSWINSIWASSPTDVYAVGLSGHIFHSTGADDWVEQKTGRQTTLNCVFGSGATDVYAVEQGGNLLHSTGDGHWSVVSAAPPPQTSSFSQLWMASSSNLYLAGDTLNTTGTNIFHFDLSMLTPEFGRLSTSLKSIWGLGANDIWAVGVADVSGPAATPIILHSTGTGTWTQKNFVPDSGSGFSGAITAVWSTSASNVYVASGNNFVGQNDGVFHSTNGGTDWTREITDTGPPTINGLWGSGSMDVWAVGDSNSPNFDGVILRSQGFGNWQPDPDLPSLKGSPMQSIFGTRFGDVYVGGNGVILHKRE